ncbi:tyrosyl-DNA phosphodiesterase-domain-containing protein [Crassisporium funariophilum]|nr:tyrosyl-DNA phosphodiesterase-domain-containing protein [Crassisporium funariophilum]
MSSEDEDIARAIALSLQETSRKPVSINLDSDEDDNVEEARFQTELIHVMNASRTESSQSQTRNASSSQTNNEQPSQSMASAFLSERAQLEKERRERQKRLRPQPSYSSIPGEEDDSDVEEPPAKRQQVSYSKSKFQRSNKLGHSSSKTSNVVPTIEQVFWDGELRQTATQHAEPRKDGLPTFRLTEVLGMKSELAFAIMSSYSLDFPWIYEFFDPSVPVIMVAQPDASGQATIKNVLPNWIRTTPFLRYGRGCQHMKFMLLFYKTGRLRVVISTANLVAYDWRDMENSVWLQDIPLRSKPIPHDPKASGDFPSSLQRMLHAVNVKPALVTMISDNHPDLPIKSIDELRQRWDWSNVRAQLVASIAGKHEGWPQLIHNGHPRLMTAVRKLGMRTGQSKKSKVLMLECQGSSLGVYTTQWLNEFHWSARGESAEDWLDGTRKAREKLPLPPVKLIFPTKTTVQESASGEQGGGTIFCRRKQWSGKNFPRSLFYDSKMVIMSFKMIIALLNDNPFSSGNTKPEFISDTEDETDDDIEVIEPAVGWAYIGSHNFTPSAWGTLSGSSFNPILNITNYEVGVIFLLKDAKEADRVACFQRPPKKYASKDEPWIQEESAYHQIE